MLEESKEICAKIQLERPEFEIRAAKTLVLMLLLGATPEMAFANSTYLNETILTLGNHARHKNLSKLQSIEKYHFGLEKMIKLFLGMRVKSLSEVSGFSASLEMVIYNYVVENLLMRMEYSIAIQAKNKLTDLVNNAPQSYDQ